MDFSYAQGSSEYRQLLKNEIVVVFLDADLIIKHVSSNNDVLGVSVGALSKGLPIKKFMPENAIIELRSFLASQQDEAVIEYEFMVSDEVRTPVRHQFCNADNEFEDGVVLRSYISRPFDNRAERLISEYGVALRYIWLINNLSAGVFMHDGNKIIYANKKLGELLGREHNELPGEPVTKFFVGQSEKAIKERLCGRNRFSVMAQHRDGSKFAVNISTQVEEPGVSYIATLEDAISFKTREQADDIFRRVFEHASEGVILLDTDKTVTWANAPIAELTGYAPEAIIGWNISSFYSEEHRADFYDTVWEMSQVLYKGVIWLRVKNGNIPVTAVITSSRNDADEVLTYILSLSPAPDTIRLSEKELNLHEDELTGLYKWDYFEQCLERKISDCNDSSGKFAVLLFDIDRFKTINELYGVELADILLKQIVARFKKTMPPETLLARKDDEFAAIIEDMASLDKMNELAERLLDTMNKPFIVSSLEIDIYISVAVAFYSDETPTKDAVLKNLYRSLSIPKLDWKSGYHIYNAEMSDAKSASFEEKLRMAIMKNEFVLYYLPKVDVRTQKLVGVEALVRWQSPDMGLLSPVRFLPMAEDAGLMPALGEIVFNMACMQLQKWRRKGHDLTLAINLSSLQLRDENLGEKFLAIMSSYDITPERVELEIMEGMAFQERSIILNTLNMLVDAGVTIALDDFGLGYSSISMLKKYPITSLKIDKSIVRGLPDDPDSCAIVSAMIAMAHSLGMRTSAEGVETMAQYEYMLGTDCDEMQGFFIGAPMPVDATEELIQSYELMESL